jgi:organic hydroperoxide reductase OsmC/OhrA
VDYTIKVKPSMFPAPGREYTWLVYDEPATAPAASGDAATPEEAFAAALAWCREHTPAAAE